MAMEVSVSEAAPVIDSVVEQLFGRLEEQNRLSGMSRNELSDRILADAARGEKIPVGHGRYLVDVSHTMKGEEMYVMVDDSLSILDVYDADAAIELHSRAPAASLTNQPQQTPPPQQEHKSMPPPTPPQTKTDPNAPVMLTWLQSDQGNGDPVTQFQETTNGKVAQEILRLIVAGVDADTLRVWSKVSKPQLRVDL